MQQLIGIVDEANPRGASDELDINLHSAALTEFIKKCPTPLTIGVQGEWGSGKTSILNSIYHELNEEGIYKQIWINSWESSLGSTPEESLLKIINEIVEDLIKADPKNENAENSKKWLMTLGKGIIRTGASALNGKVGEIVDELLETSSHSIKQLRESLSTLAQDVMERTTNPYKKIIVYVDDLDRIEPKEAVKILELLKNIFSIHGCVFVLAIDYQVVVKGLEHKFGKRTEENEWEFRAFFDKIIQLPFMMPMGQYNIGKYVSNLLRQIGFIENDEIDESTIQTFVSHSIGGNPRAIKRLVNSLSLINLFSSIKNQRNTEEDTDSNLDDKSQKSLLFALVCLQIAYPEIYNRLISRPDFENWNEEWAFKITRQKEEEDTKFEKNFELAKQTDDFDEDWEQALYRVCYTSPRYKNRVTEISRFLSIIKDEILKNSNDRGGDLAEVLSQTAVTSVVSTDEVQNKTTESNRDYSKFIFEGKEYGKGRLALAVVKKYVEDNPTLTYEELLKIFPQELHGRGKNAGVFNHIEDALEIINNTNRKRHFVNENEMIKLSDCTIAVSNQWGQGNIQSIVKIGKDLGYRIS